MPQFLAVYTASPDNSMGPGVMEPSEIGRGMAAWTQWMVDHGDKVVVTGGPVGKTRKISKAGMEEIRNLLSGFVVVEAASQDEAARLFIDHPHFSIFPGEGVEVMEILPIPTA